MNQFPVSGNELEVIFESVLSVGLQGILWLISVKVIHLDSNPNKFCFMPITLAICLYHKTSVQHRYMTAHNEESPEFRWFIEKVD